MHGFIRATTHALQPLLMVGLCLLLSACAAFSDLKNNLNESMFGTEPANPPQELEPIKTAYEGKILWSTEVGKSGRFSYSPLLDERQLYTANSLGDVMEIAADTGKIGWRTNLGEPVSAPIGQGGGLLLAGTSKGHLFAISLSGKPLWSANLSSEIQGRPAYFDGTVIVRTGDQHIYGIDAADGKRKWVYERSTPALSLKTQAGLVVDSGAIYAGFPGGKIVAIRAEDGKMLWEATVAQPKGVTEIERITDVTSLPVVDGPVVYSVAYQGKIAAIDRVRGQVLWNRDISSYVGLNVDNGKIYVTHNVGSVYALDISNGKTFWRQGGLGYRNLTVPVVTGSNVAVGDLEGYIHLLSQDDGSMVGRLQTNKSALMSLVAGANNTLYTQSRDGMLYAVSFK